MSDCCEKSRPCSSVRGHTWTKENCRSYRPVALSLTCTASSALAWPPRSAMLADTAAPPVCSTLVISCSQHLVGAQGPELQVLWQRTEMPAVSYAERLLEQAIRLCTAVQKTAFVYPRSS